MVRRPSRPAIRSSVALHPVFKSIVAFLKKPAVWLLGIVAAAIATSLAAIVTGIFTPISNGIVNDVKVAACKLTYKPPAANEEKFIFLVSPLAGDNDDAMTDLVMRGFLQENDMIDPHRICESFDVGSAHDTDAAKKKIYEQAASLIKANNADLLVYGNVNPASSPSISIWAVNEHGGCGPKGDDPIVTQNGVLPKAFQQRTVWDLISGSFRDIAAACDNPKQVDWTLFGERITKMGKFLSQIQAKLAPNSAAALELTDAYAQAMMLLYQYNADASWFDKAAQFDLQLINGIQTNTPKTVSGKWWGDYATLLLAKAEKSNSADDRNAAIQAYEKAYAFDPTDGRTLQNLGSLYFAQKNYDEAIRYYSEGIKADPKSVETYMKLGVTYETKDDYADAAQDYRQLAQLQPSNSDAFGNLCGAEAVGGQLQQALADCNESLKLKPNQGWVMANRGYTYLRLGQLDEAMGDLNAALRLDAKDASSLYLRGVVETKKGDATDGNNDIAAAKAIQPNVADWYSSHGIN